MTAARPDPPWVRISIDAATQARRGSWSSRYEFALNLFELMASDNELRRPLGEMFRSWLTEWLSDLPAELEDPAAAALASMSLNPEHEAAAQRYIDSHRDEARGFAEESDGRALAMLACSQAHQMGRHLN